ncbi:MAG: RagB/SusD family nutrient uptake outer membrane protein [Odoribacteraceae bacterium]|jgi:hypothetical protein|nr:RagB/SusD family nutrient uptake outer membrane protein [Odoribacteraceae bacterium]
MKYIPLLALLLFSCSEWLDVSPRVQIKEDENFTTPQGFKDALTGVYLLMTEENAYGRELSFGLVDVLGKQYTSGFATLNEYYYPNIYDYTADASKTKFAGIWSSMYNTIANVNSLISYIDKADSNAFNIEEYHVIRGEAYALRAFLHFDLARLFAPSFLVGPDEKGIPYVTHFDNQVTPLSTTRKVLDKALFDLTIAEKELKNDPVTRGESSSDYTSFLRNRHYHFNYYAVKLLQARIYLYKGEHGNARRAAEEVIAQSLFAWVPEAQVVTSTIETRNLVFHQEIIFAINVNNIPDIAFGTTGILSWFTSGYGGFTKSIYNWNTVYESDKYSGDYRYQYLMGPLIDNYYVASYKLYQPASVYGQDFINKIPVMRLSEAYYIAAESAFLLGEKAAATRYLNTVREHRNINDPLPETITDDALREEIRKEYVKEFICEGQLFYYYKRVDSETIQFYSPYSGPVARAVYRLPLPDDEIDYGQRYLETDNN